jgi:hypothetical protein
VMDCLMESYEWKVHEEERCVNPPNVRGGRRVVGHGYSKHGG